MAQINFLYPMHDPYLVIIQRVKPNLPLSSKEIFDGDISGI